MKVGAVFTAWKTRSYEIASLRTARLKSRQPAA